MQKSGVFSIKLHEILKYSVSIDSRNVKKGDIFWVLKGKKCDGHNFVLDSVRQGAAGVVIENSKQQIAAKIKKINPKIKIWFVNDTLQALFELAKFKRSQFKIPIIGITGSVGKTTTKEMLASILNKSGLPNLTSFKNQNTDIGLCLNIFKLSKNHKVAVFELGINDNGEMDRLVDILKPTICVVTNVYSAHTQGLGDLQNITTEKTKIFKYADVAIINDQIEFLPKSEKIIKFGNKKQSEVRAENINSLICSDGNIETKFQLNLFEKKSQIKLQVGHNGFVNNALASAAIALCLKISFEKIVAGLQDFVGFERRFEIKKLKSNCGFLINDCYNACPQSMKEALIAFENAKFDGTKIAILGDMLELGKQSDFWHEQMGKLFEDFSTINQVVLVGQNSKLILQNLPKQISVYWMKDWQEAKAFFEQNDKNNPKTEKKCFLVKASSGIHLDKVAAELIK